MMSFALPSEPEHGVVVIMDMRDISISSFDVRYVTNILSVLRVSGPKLQSDPFSELSSLKW